MGKFRFSRRSKNNLKGVHSDLVKVCHRALALTEIDFVVICGRRTKKHQQHLVAIGASKTMNSRHLTGHAVDFAPYPIDWNDLSKFKKISVAFLKAGKELNIPIRWGGDWDMDGDSKDERFYDGGHIELQRKHYP